MASTHTATELQELPPVTMLPCLDRPKRPTTSYGRTPSYPDSIQPLTPATPAQQTPPSRVFEATPSVTSTKRLLIITLIVVANTIQFTSAFSTIAGGIAINKVLGQDIGPGQANWMAAAYSLTQGAFVLITGRLGAIYGHQRLTLIGLLLFSVFSLINGFCSSHASFVALRALTGIGGGVFMPNAVATIMLMVPPGRARNVLMGLFAASPPVGGVMGALLAGVVAEKDKFSAWTVFFGMLAASSLACLTWLWVVLPEEHPVDKGGKIDYVGAFLGLGSLLLFNFTWNQAPVSGWDTPYLIAALCLSVVLFIAFILWERSPYPTEPIMPLAVFAAPTFSALIVVVTLSYMTVGICMWYSLSWQQVLRGVSVLECGINFLPFGIGSVAAVALSAYLVPRVAAQWIMAIGLVSGLIASLLIATQPVQQSYWPQMFPAIVSLGFSPDFLYLAAQIIASNSVSRKHQGVASSLIGTLNLYGNALGLGVAATIETEVVKRSEGPGSSSGENSVIGYRAALYFGAGIAAVSLLLNFVFVRVPKNDREGWEEDSAPVEQEAGVVLASAIQRRNAV
ncbi:hypothetical protein NLU13_0185 [Sarocladium strictum]|uniref:Major facilitator superfamily (MFS) profile domain-containing protein n=1 Tax=Sarocladium strictum TaxID=5046 RepID=A0AA39GNL7_SARSR|nr:hypothetical protein NLU13_0185 [Sarocladium strictum]